MTIHLILDGVPDSPSWPVDSPRERDQLDAAAQRHGLRLIEGSCVRSHRPLEAVVVGLGPEVLESADLYARLTRRRAIHVDSLEQALSVPGLEVLVTSLARLRIDLFEQLARLRPGWAPGIVFAEPEQLRLRCLVSALAAWAPFVGERLTQLVMHPADSLGYQSVHEVPAYQADGPAIRSTFSADAALLILHGHSDGIDGMLSEQHTYCARIEQDAEHFALKNRCQALNWCHRHELAMDDPRLVDHLVRPSETSAGIFLFDVCWGLSPPEDILSPPAGLGARLAHNVSVSAVVSTWKPSFGNIETIRDLCEDIIAGESLGDAVGRHNAARTTWEHDHPLLLFGEPRAHLRSRPSPTRPIQIIYDASEPADELPDPSRPSSALEKIQYFIGSPRHRESRVQKIRAALDETTALAEIDLATSRLREEILDQLMYVVCDIVPRHEHHWTARDQPVRVSRDAHHRCVGIDQPMRAIARFKVRGGPREPDLRLLSICPRCGLCEILDSALQAYVRATEDGRLELVTEAEYEDIRIQLVVVSQGQKYRERSVHPWPCDEDGRVARVVELPPIEFVGMLHVNAVVIADGMFSSFSFAYPGSRS